MVYNLFIRKPISKAQYSRILYVRQRGLILLLFSDG